MLSSEMSYFIGFAHADGHLRDDTRNRGRFTIEIKRDDEDILQSFKSLLDVNSVLGSRTRDTNFKKEFKSSFLRVCSLPFRDMLKEYGVDLPKSELSVPKEVIHQDYVRGYVDGNGSLGLEKRGLPFLSVTIISDPLARFYMDYVEKVTGRPHDVHRNRRDNVYNIALFKEEAIQFAKHLYQDATIFLQRKWDLCVLISKWKRPADMKRVHSRKKWLPKEDEYVLSHEIEESVGSLSRTERSVKMRIWRLKNMKRTKEG